MNVSDLKKHIDKLIADGKWNYEVTLTAKVNTRTYVQSVDVDETFYEVNLS